MSISRHSTHEELSEFQGWPHQTQGSGHDVDLPAASSMNVGSGPGWACAHSCLSSILQSSRYETVRQRPLVGTALGHGKSVKAVCLACEI